MLVKRILNPAKKNNIEGETFHLIFLGADAVLYDKLWDAPIIYAPKALVRAAIANDKKLPALLPRGITEIVLYVYKVQDTGEIKRVGEPIRGNPTEIVVPNY